jgi:ABC-type antimicrobial peptide transport system ATPase subunit
LHAIPGAAMGGYEVAPGCSFSPRCPFAQSRCHTAKPPRTWVGSLHAVECWRASELCGTDCTTGAAPAARGGSGSLSS